MIPANLSEIGLEILQFPLDFLRDVGLMVSYRGNHDSQFARFEQGIPAKQAML
jgi:hypothetical protein